MSQIVPLRGLPEKILSNQIFELGIWLERLLSLEGQKSTERMIVLLPEIKKSSWGMSIEEIKNAFIFYTEGKLTIEPRDNYLTVILYNKIINEYKSKYKKKKVVKEKPKMTQQEKDEIMEEAISTALEIYKNTEAINLPSPKYDYLDSKGRLQKAFGLDNAKWKSYKLTKYAKVKEELKYKYKNKKAKSRDEKDDIKNIVRNLESAKNGLVIIECKKQILESYFDILISR